MLLASLHRSYLQAQPGILPGPDSWQTTPLLQIIAGRQSCSSSAHGTADHIQTYQALRSQLISFSRPGSYTKNKQEQQVHAAPAKKVLSLMRGKVELLQSGLIGHCQLVASARPSPGEHLPSVLSGHARTETVFVGSLSPRGLISTFHLSAYFQILYSKSGTKVKQSTAITKPPSSFFYHPFILDRNSILLLVPVICLSRKSMASSGFISAR